jgi:hypothetical protein
VTPFLAINIHYSPNGHTHISSLISAWYEFGFIQGRLEISLGVLLDTDSSYPSGSGQRMVFALKMKSILDIDIVYAVFRWYCVQCIELNTDHICRGSLNFVVVVWLSLQAPRFLNAKSFRPTKDPEFASLPKTMLKWRTCLFCSAGRAQLGPCLCETW